MHTWYMHVIQRDFDVNFNNTHPFLFFLTTYVISSYNRYHNHIRKKKRKTQFQLFSSHLPHQSHDVLSITLIFSVAQYA